MNEHSLGARHHAKKFPLTIPFKLQDYLWWGDAPHTYIPISRSGSTHEGQLTSERRGLQTPGHIPHQQWRARSPSGPVSASPSRRERARAGAGRAEAASCSPGRPRLAGQLVQAQQASRPPRLTSANGAYSHQPSCLPSPGASCWPATVSQGPPETRF